MSVERLTDEQILDYLDGNLSEKERQQVEWSIALSDENKKLVQEYHALYGQLSQHEVYSFSPRFEHAVLEQLAISRRQGKWFSRLTAATVGAIVIASGVVLAGMLDMTPLIVFVVRLMGIASSFALPTEGFLSIIHSAAGFVGDNGDGVALFVVAGAILMLFHILDRVLLGALYRGPARP